MKRSGVTICIPVFNDSVLARYAVESIESVADEILVYNDAGTSDRYWGRFRDYCIGRRKVRIMQGEAHEGFTCRNHMIHAASYSILHFMDADDILVPESIGCYEDAIHFAERTRGAVCPRIQELHGDIFHSPRDNVQLYDTTHSIAYNAAGLLFTKTLGSMNPAGYENLWGVPIFTYPDKRRLSSVEALDYEAFDGRIMPPVIAHLAGIKENRLQAYRAVAYDYQRLHTRPSMDEYVSSAAAEAKIPVNEYLETKAICYLNSYGPGVPIAAIPLACSLPLTVFADVAACVRTDGYLIGRDDGGWKALYDG